MSFLKDVKAAFFSNRVKWTRSKCLTMCAHSLLPTGICANFELLDSVQGNQSHVSVSHTVYNTCYTGDSCFQTAATGHTDRVVFYILI